MDTATVTLVVSAIVSTLLQAVKDHTSINGGTLRYVAVALGVIGGGIVGATQGDGASQTLLVNAIIGALATPGVHAAFYQNDTILSKVVKGVGSSIFTPTTPKPSA